MSVQAFTTRATAARFGVFHVGMAMCSTLLLAGLLFGPAAQAAQVVTIDWGKSQRFEMQRSVAAGEVLELCGPLAKGQGVDWQFVADHPLAFNIHHHIGKQVQYAERRTRTKSLTSRFVPDEATEYCWMWTAPKQQAIRLQVLLRY